MDRSISVFGSRSLAGRSAHSEEGRAESNDRSELDHDGQSQMVVEMFEDLTLFDVRIVSAVDKPVIYICRADGPQLRLSSGTCIRDWKISRCLRTKTFKASGSLVPAALASLATLDVVSIP